MRNQPLTRDCDERSAIIGAVVFVIVLVMLFGPSVVALVRWVM